MDHQSLIQRIYNDIKSTGSLGGVKRLYTAVKKINPSVKLTEIRRYLKSERGYTLHVLKPKKYTRRKILAPKPRVILTCDIAEMQLLSEYNNNVRYLLVAIDVFSRYLRVVTLIKNDAVSSYKGIKTILELPEYQGVS